MASSSSRLLTAIKTKETVDPTSTPSPTEFQIIVKGAKYQDTTAINNVLKKVSINVRDTSNVPPISRLAEEGEVEAVEFLKKHYYVAESWAAQGYAKTLNFNALDNLIKKYPERQSYLFAEAVCGFGLSIRNSGSRQGPDYAARLITANPQLAGMLHFYFAMGLGEAGYININDYINGKSFGYVQLNGLALGLGLGNHETVFLTLLNVNPLYKTPLLTRFIGGLGIGGHEKTILKYLKTHSELLFVLIPSVIEGLARCFQMDSIEKIVKLYPIRQRELITSKVAGLVSGGYMHEAEKLISAQPLPHNDFISVTITSCARHYHTSNAFELMGKFPDESIASVTGFAAIGLTSEVGAVIRTYPDRLFGIIDAAVENYSDAGNFPEADKIIDAYPDHRYELLKAKLTGLIRAGYLEMAQSLYAALKIEFVDDFSFDTLMANALASLGHNHEVVEFLFECKDYQQRLELAKIVVIAYVQNYFFDAAREFLESAFGVKDILLEEMAANFPILENEEEYQLLLSTIPKTLRAELVEAYDRLNPSDNISRHVLRSEKLSKLMSHDQLNYQQAVGFLKPDVQFLMMKGMLLINKHNLGEPILFFIASFLVKTDVEDLKELQQKLIGRFFVPKRNHLADITNKQPKLKQPSINLLSKDRQSYDIMKIR